MVYGSGLQSAVFIRNGEAITRLELPMHDVVIVGASIAGCTAAILFAGQGLNVALLERETDTAAYKKICTHYIQPSAVPTLERLGLVSPIERAGGVRNHRTDFWTRWGWIHSPETQGYGQPITGYNIRRQTLDPMLRKLAANTPGVEFMPDHTAQNLLKEGGQVAGVRVQRAKAGDRDIRARLVVAADGHNSRVAELAGLAAKRKAHGRFAYFAYYRGLRTSVPGLTQIWFLEPDVAYSFPNDDDQTVLAAAPATAKLDLWKRDIETNFVNLFESLPAAPAIREAKRVSPFLGMLKLPNQSRPVVQSGLALIGDAALASDPIWGAGCGWAFQSAEWLVDCTAEAVRRGIRLDAALAAYRRRHRRQLAGHAFLIADFASGRGFNPLEKLMFSAAARDPACAAHFAAFGGRTISVSQFLAPSALARAVRVNIGHLACGATMPFRPPPAGRRA
jgi:2-polyprenyl-6-methoxyphenol hydroxylase-like FAD-dependent oxidoreductase